MTTMPRDSHELFRRETRALIYGLQANAIQRMLDFDYTVGRDTLSVAAVINPGRTGDHKTFWGHKEVLIPVYPNIAAALARHPDIDVLVNFASYRSAVATSLEALDHPQIRCITVIAEGVPERRARELRATAQQKGVTIIGPATVGAIKAGAFKVGNTGGTIDNIIESKLHRPGSVGFVSKSGGMSNECYNIIARNSDGIYEGVAIGGDAYPGSSLLDHLLRFQGIPGVKLLVCLGEVGGEEEYKVVDAVKSGAITKPLVMWVTGTCASVMPQGVQFGHAGAKADSKRETAAAKNDALRDAGVVVPHSFNDFGKAIHDTYERLRQTGVVHPAAEVAPRPVPREFKDLAARKLVRRPTSFRCTISDDSGEELLYAGHKIGTIISENYSIGDVIGLLWFKERLPRWSTEFIDMVLKLTADHGPAVSGAHNTIVTARAGRDLMSAVAAGLLTIGPRFGGAVAGAAVQFKQARDAGLSPADFVASMKKQDVPIQGIGHRTKSVRRPDMRVQLLKQYAAKNFPRTPHLDYALQVEKITTQKKDTLILNVDGAIGTLLLDMMCALDWSEERIQAIVGCGGLNGFFALGRTIGLIGHYIDQCTQKAGLFRLAWDDILYDVPQPH
jgi:succinyl-CoA synthetase alpha subunit